MSASRAHSAMALAAVGVAIATGCAAGVLGPVTSSVGVIVLLLGVARQRGLAFARILERPKLFAVLGAVYVFVFLADVFILGRLNPVPALGRLVIFLIAAEVLAGDRMRGHRPILFGMLLMVAAAAQTTDLWFAFPLAAFTWTAVLSQMSSTSRRLPASDPLPFVSPLAAARVTVASLLLAGLFFVLIPRAGAGWGRTTVARSDASDLETGLSGSVRLGSVGKIKSRRSVAFRATVTSGKDDLEGVYWRARAYDQWTGHGWIQRERARDEVLPLPAGEPVPVPPDYASRSADLVVSITMGRSELSALPVPGRGLWLRSPRETTLIASPDGTLSPTGALLLRTYEVGSVGNAPPRASTEPGAETDPPIPETYLDVHDLDPEVKRWALNIAPTEASPASVAQAFVADLSRREYSLDTRRVDPAHPVASFLAGAPAHCEYFASAMALGLRVRGIPARVVGGFLGSRRQPFGKGWIVRDSHAHLWTEAVLPGRGWVPFDPTPVAGRTPPAADALSWLGGALERFVLAWDTWVIGLDLRDQVDLLLTLRDWAADLARAAYSARAGIVLAVLVALVALAILALRRFRRRSGSRERVGLPAFYRSFLALARARGLELLPTETAGGFATRAGRELGDEAAVGFVSRMYERERFGGRPPSALDLRDLELALAGLARGIPTNSPRGGTSSTRRGPG